MTLNLAALYLCAIAAITMLGLFARHNRKIGWVKERKTFVSDLLELQAAWDEIDRAVAGTGPAAASARRAEAVHPTASVSAPDFSQQLGNLQKALGHSAVQTPVEAREEVSA